MSVTFPTSSGSVENRNDSAFQGLTPYDLHARATEVLLIFRRSASRREDQMRDAQPLRRRLQGLGHDRAVIQCARSARTFTVTQSGHAARLVPLTPRDDRRRARCDQPRSLGCRHRRPRATPSGRAWPDRRRPSATAPSLPFPHDHQHATPTPGQVDSPCLTTSDAQASNYLRHAPLDGAPASAQMALPTGPISRRWSPKSYCWLRKARHANATARQYRSRFWHRSPDGIGSLRPGVALLTEPPTGRL